MSSRLAYSLLAASLLAACTTDPSSFSPTTGDDDAEPVPADVPAATPAVAPPRLSAFFAVPKTDGTGDSALQDKVISLAGLAAHGSHVRIAMYGWSSTKAADAFIAAHARGVDVRVILDKQENEVDGKLNPAVRSLQAALGAGGVTLCTRGRGSCQGTNINHNKFYTFSALTDGSKDVVVQSSANLTSLHLHNNLVISREDTDLYKGYNAYWADLAKQKEDLDFYRSVDGNHTIAYFFPRAEGDTIVSVLDRVHCHADSKLRVTMAFFAGRPEVADALVARKKDGCDVQVLMRTAGPLDSAAVIRQLRAAHIRVGLYPAQHGTNIHSKYLLVDSDYETNGKVEHRKLVFTGSHNYLESALRENDEALLRVDEATVFADFLANWDTIRAQITAAEPKAAHAEDADDAADPDAEPGAEIGPEIEAD